MLRDFRLGLTLVGGLLVVCLVVLIPLQMTSNAASIEEPPSHPETVEQVSATNYVESLERTRVHNRIVNRTNPDLVEVDCDSRHLVFDGPEYYLSVECETTVHDDGAVSHDETSPWLYRVSEAGYARTNATVESVSPVRTNESASTESSRRSVRLYNFDDREHAFDVTITATGSNETRSAAYEVTAPAESGRTLEAAVTPPGTYHVVVRSEAHNASDTLRVQDREEEYVVFADADGMHVVSATP